jgi:hypothetical protein
MNNSIVGTTYTTAVQFGSRDEIKELADRLVAMMPGGQNYTKSEALTLAQIAVAHGLDPFNGEVWLIKNEETGKVYGALIGLKGHRKHAKKQADYWGVGNNGGFERITDPAKLKAYGAVETSIVYEYKIMDSVTLEAYTRSVGNLIKAGVPFEAAQKQLGPAPLTLGVGIWTQGDKTKMKPAHCAMFRAEKDALKRRFDVKFTIEIEGRIVPMSTSIDPDEDLHAEEIEGQYSELVDDPQADERAEEQTGNLFTIEQQIVMAHLAENEFAAKNLLKKRNPAALLEPLVWARCYRGHRDNGVDSDTAAALANEGKAP